MSHITIKSLADENRLDELASLNLIVHSINERFCTNVFELNPSSNKPEYHRYVLDHGRIVAGTSLLRHTLQWYSSTIPAGETGLVGTLEEHRGKGYATALMNDWLDTMRDDGTPLSFLWGIPDFYEKFHYHYAYPNHGTSYVSLPRSCILDWEPAGTIRPATAEDRFWIRKLYRAYNAGLVGCQVRDEKQWEHYFKLTENAKNVQWWVPEDPLGGYALVAGSPPAVWEIAAPSPNSLRILVSGIFENRPDLERLDFFHHPDMPIGRWLYRWGARVSSPEDIWKGTWGGMVRLMKPSALLAPMSDKLAERIAASRFFAFIGEIAFQSEVGGAIIDISDGEIKIHENSERTGFQIPARVLTPMMTGYRGFERFRDELKDIPDSIADILAVLFPRDTVFMYTLLYADEELSKPEYCDA